MPKKKKRGGKNFWDYEYKTGDHLALSVNPSEDLQKFTRWLFRRDKHMTLNVTASVLDIGCGNGRNLIWLSREFGIHGHGYDISHEAVKQAMQVAKSEDLKLSFEAHTAGEVIPLPDESQDIVLDMMVSHFLNENERLALIKEIHRVLKPGGYFYYKTFLLNEDKHAERLIEEHGAGEENTYVHPHMRVAEHVSTEAEIEKLYGEYFDILETKKSHRHKGKYGKRRSISVYMQKM